MLFLVCGLLLKQSAFLIHFYPLVLRKILGIFSSLLQGSH
ncbi:hypothetical protein THOB06_110020 [Vibrio rotiferianus]|nr:hypothetical protein THOG10_110020 [Vibrio rotiferianus]CAH1560527.1 hypothetical protein THOB06_110020 [Vibrio rotiferianus]